MHSFHWYGPLSLMNFNLHYEFEINSILLCLDLLHIDRQRLYAWHDGIKKYVLIKLLQSNGEWKILGNKPFLSAYVRLLSFWILCNDPHKALLYKQNKRNKTKTKRKKQKEYHISILPGWSNLVFQCLANICDDFLFNCNGFIVFFTFPSPQLSTYLQIQTNIPMT